MRRRALEVTDEPFPAALAIGPCIEVWADGQRPGPWSSENWKATTAFRNWANARRHHEREHRGPDETSQTVHRAPYSAAFLVDSGRSAQLEAYLAAGNASTGDLDRLRNRARALGTVRTQRNT